MKEKSLREYMQLLKNEGLLLSCNAKEEALNRPVQHLTYSSLGVTEGTLFICKGLSFKEQYLAEAIEKGAFCYVSERPYTQAGGTIPCLQVSDVRAAMSELGRLYYDDIWNRRLMMAGITGTKGKSTTAAFLKAIIDEHARACGEKEAGFISGIYTYDGERTEKAHNMTTPETLELQELLSRCAHNGCRYVVMETSSQALKYGRTAALLYETCAFLNISEDHISPVEHPDFEDYFAAKLKIFAQSRTACVNMDMEPALRERVLLEAKKCRRLITFASELAMTEEEAAELGIDIYGCDIKATAEGIRLTVKTGGRTQELAVSIGGAYNAGNALAAVALASSLDIPFSEIKAGLAAVKVAGRMELFRLPDKPVDVIVDYAHNKVSYQTLLSDLRKLYPQKKILLVAGCVGGKAQNRRKELAEMIDAYADRAILTAQYPGSEPVLQICGQIMSYLKSTKPVSIIEDRDAAVEQACLEAGEDWIVVAAGSDEDRERIKNIIERK